MLNFFSFSKIKSAVIQQSYIIKINSSRHWTAHGLKELVWHALLRSNYIRQKGSPDIDIHQNWVINQDSKWLINKKRDSFKQKTRLLYTRQINQYNSSVWQSQFYAWHNRTNRNTVTHYFDWRYVSLWLCVAVTYIPRGTLLNILFLEWRFFALKLAISPIAQKASLEK